MNEDIISWRTTVDIFLPAPGSVSFISRLRDRYITDCSTVDIELHGRQPRVCPVSSHGCGNPGRVQGNGDCIFLFLFPRKLRGLFPASYTFMGLNLILLPQGSPP